MNLRWVDAVLIFLSAALAVLFRHLVPGADRQDHGIASLIAALVAFALSIALVVDANSVLPPKDQDTAMKNQPSRLSAASCQRHGARRLPESR